MPRRSPGLYLTHIEQQSTPSIATVHTSASANGVVGLVGRNLGLQLAAGSAVSCRAKLALQYAIIGISKWQHRSREQHAAGCDQQRRWLVPPDPEPEQTIDGAETTTADDDEGRAKSNTRRTKQRE